MEKLTDKNQVRNRLLTGVWRGAAVYYPRQYNPIGDIRWAAKNGIIVFGYADDPRAAWDFESKTLGGDDNKTFVEADYAPIS